MTSISAVFLGSSVGCGHGDVSAETPDEVAFDESELSLSTESVPLLGNAILRGSEEALDAVREERLGAPVAARIYAIVHAAMFDAVNGMNRTVGFAHRPSILVGTDGAPSPFRASRSAAALAAGYTALAELVPERAETLQTRFDLDLRALRFLPDDFIQAGVRWGSEVGERAVEARIDDGSSPVELLPGGDAPGQFRADFGSAQFRSLTPFGIADPLRYRGDGPPALESEAYAEALNEVQDLGDGRIDDPEKLATVRFWAGSSGSARPPGEWFKIAATVTRSSQLNVSISSTAQLFALLGVAMGDATIVAWDNKFLYRFWRPATAIQSASTDGNDATVEDFEWTPRNGSIGSSPEYTSGQSTFAGAGSTILAGFFGRDSIRFSFEGDGAIDGPRRYDSFSASAEEAGRARIFAGIHFEFSNQDGQEAGRLLASEILWNFYR
ncbi:MAG: vanadium-dependent haloperoxidase [Myxococcota bacterium]